jgi:hypothetical protein
MKGQDIFELITSQFEIRLLQAHSYQKKGEKCYFLYESTFDLPCQVTVLFIMFTVIILMVYFAL